MGGGKVSQTFIHNYIICINKIQGSNSLFISPLLKGKLFLYLGSVRMIQKALFVNLGMLKLTNRFQTFRDYSFSSLEPYRNHSTL